MTLRETMARHARTVLTRLDHFGEEVTYRFKSGAPDRTVRAVVNRRGKQRHEDGQFVGVLAEVFVPRDATDGVTAIVDGDQLLFGLSEGGEAVPHRISEVVSEDAAGFLLRCWS